MTCVDPDAMLMSVAYDATESMASRGHIVVLDLYYHGLPRLVMWQRAVLMSMVCTTTGDHAEVCGPCQYWRPCGYLWFMFLLTAKGKEGTFAMVLMTTHSQLRKKDMEGFCDNPYPQKKQPRKKVIEENSKDAEL